MKEAECYPGKRIGRLTLIERRRVETKHYGKRWEWLCKCDCGEMRRVLTFQLGPYKSRTGIVDCGNHTKTKLVKNGKKGVKAVQDLSDSNQRSPWRRLYAKWSDMHRRCEQPQLENYPNYGGRGIRVCKEWAEYEPFKEWAISQGYDPNNKNRNEQTIDRIDVNGNYEPSNCRLTNTVVQANNTTKNVNIEINGVVHTLQEWSNITEIKYPTLSDRYKRGDRGEYLIRPIDKKSSWTHPMLYDFKGRKVTMRQLMDISGISNTTLKIRYEKGLRDDDLIKLTNRTKKYKKKEVE